MQYNNLQNYVKKFFSELELTAEEGKSSTKELLEQSILAFLSDQTKDSAFDVYKLFFGTYRIMLEGSNK